MAHPLRAALDALVAQLDAAGVRATVDPRNVNPPCALVTVDRVDATLGGCPTVDALVLLVAPDVGMPAALDTLGDMLDRVATVPGVSAALPDTFTGPAAGQPLPAFRLTIPTST